MVARCGAVAGAGDMRGGGGELMVLVLVVGTAGWLWNMGGVSEEVAMMMKVESGMAVALGR